MLRKRMTEFSLSFNRIFPSALILFVFFIPTIRVGAIPIRVEDFLIFMVFFYLVLHGYTISKYQLHKISSFIFIVIFIVLVALIVLINGEDLQYKNLVIAMNYIKYILGFILISSFTVTPSSSAILVAKITLLIQFFIIFFQKFDILGFASGLPYYIIVNIFAVNNVYSSSANNISELISTHMNFSFRPVGTIGSATREGFLCYLLAFTIFQLTSSHFYRYVGWFILLFTFSKIGIIFAFFYEVLFLSLFRKNILRFIAILLAFAIASPLIYLLFVELGVINNLLSTIAGENRGVTHRLIVLDAVFSQSFLNLLFGNYGSLPFAYFDSGLMLNIYRFGLVIYILQYFCLWLVCRKLLNKGTLYFFIFAFLFADLTFGSFHYNQFSSLAIALICLSSIYTKRGIGKTCV